MRPPDPRDEALLDRAVVLLQSPVELAPDFERRVMARVRVAPQPRPRSFLWWLTERREIRVPVRPIWAVAVAAAAVLMFAVGQFSSTESTPGSNEVIVTFLAPFGDARSVAVAGSFSDWEPLPLRRTSDGSFELQMVIEAGVHEYMFVIDDERWVSDPLAELFVDDGFGRRNSLLVAGEAGT